MSEVPKVKQIIPIDFLDCRNIIEVEQLEEFLDKYIYSSEDLKIAKKTLGMLVKVVNININKTDDIKMKKR